MSGFYKRKIIRIVLLMFVVVVLLGLGWSGISLYAVEKNKSQKKTNRFAGQQAVPVTVATVSLGTMPHIQNALGTVTANNNVVVRSRVDGQLLRLLAHEGQTVKAGQLLAEIDPRAFQAALKQAQGQLARDQALLRAARLDLDRYRTLWAQDAIAKQQYDTQQELVKQYEGMVLSDQGGVDNAELQLSFTRITVPTHGRVGLRQVDPGNFVRASDTNGIFTLTQTQPITVLFAIPEAALEGVRQRLKEKITVEIWNRDNKSKLASGYLASIDNQVNLTTGTVMLRAQFANQDDRLFPNQFVNVQLILEVRNRVRLIPVAAVLRGTPGDYVYLMGHDHSVTVRPIKLGLEHGEVVEVLDGLQEHDQIVVEGTDKLREGSRVVPKTIKIL